MAGKIQLPPKAADPAPRSCVDICGARFDLKCFVHPGGEMMMNIFATAGASSLELLFQYHQFNAGQFYAHLKPFEVGGAFDAKEYETRMQPFKRYHAAQRQVRKQLQGGVARHRWWAKLSNVLLPMIGPVLAHLLLISRTPLCTMALAVANAAYLHVCWVWCGHGISHGLRPAWLPVSWMQLSVPWVPSDLMGWNVQHTLLHHTFTMKAQDEPDEVATMFDPDLSFAHMARLSEDTAWQPHHEFQAFYLPVLFVLTIPHILMESLLATVLGQFLFYSSIRVKSLNWLKSVVSDAVMMGGAFFFVSSHWQSANWLLYFIALGAAGICIALPNVVTHTNAKVQDVDLAGKDFLETIMCTSTSYGGAAASWLTAGLSKQIEHHLCPGLPFTQLATMTPIVKRICKDEGLEYKEFDGFWQCLQSWWWMVRYLSRKPKQSPHQKCAAGFKVAGG